MGHFLGPVFYTIILIVQRVSYRVIMLSLPPLLKICSTVRFNVYTGIGCSGSVAKVPF